MEITKEQRAAIEAEGRTIVSASAGSGKTFVMIKKLVAAIESGVDLDNILAVTFTKKAAAQMKDKLRSAVIERMEGADEITRARLKTQLSKIGSASISTIHSFCSHLLRTYFYAVGIDGTFDIISADDAPAKEYKARAVDTMFERYYDGDNRNFKLLLKFYRKKRGDGFLKYLILSGYEKLRINAGYLSLLQSVNKVYTQEGFESVCAELNSIAKGKYERLKEAVKSFKEGFASPRPEYEKIFGEMISSMDMAAQNGIFAPQPPLTATRKPADKTEKEKEAGELYTKFRKDIADRYKKIRDDISDEETERKRFFESGETAKAFAEVLKDFDAEYTAVKRDENKLDYNDLEHLTLALLEDGEVRAEINAKYACVFVDEYQDVNPVQEQIISRVGGANVFLVGDVKQAIYGFRGSKSLFFAEKFERLEDGDGNALRLTSNFRSSDGVINFVNKLFSEIMTADTCGFDYSRGSLMKRGGGYPENFGSAQIHIFGKDEEERSEPEIYSVKTDNKVKYSREGLAVLEVVRRELKSKRFDLKSGGFVDTQAGDICILTRKRNKAAADIVRALTDAGYAVSGAQEANIMTRPEVKQMVDILSFIDNTKQDIPLATSLLSPLGGMTCDELSAIRIASKGRISFRECCKRYTQYNADTVARKLNNFYARIEYLRELAEIFTASEIIDIIAEETGLEALYSADGGEKLKNIRRLSAEGAHLSVQAFLAKLKDGYEISAPSAASSDSIKIMTMHASKGLEFPVVIIADICSTYKGREAVEMPFDDKYGFAPKCYDGENMLTYPTVLRRLANGRAEREELKNEFNLFYVACTRAMCRLHIMAEEAPEFNPSDTIDAVRYSEMFDISKYAPEEIRPAEIAPKAEKINLISSADGELKNKIAERFMREYTYAKSVNLPVKSSASAILRLSEEDIFRPHELFSGEGETGTERGTAYHRFLELCDFSVTDEDGICAELEKFVKDNLITEEQKNLLNISDLAEILKMPVFRGLEGARLLREQEFLCRLPANELFETEAKDCVLVQGAIDLLAETKDGFFIIDYKYSHKTDEQLISAYGKQLALYKKAVAAIMDKNGAGVKTAIVNIFLKRQIIL